MKQTGAAYPEYKPSGVPWLGQVPAEWQVGLLKRFVRVRYGLGQPPPELADGPPLIRATNINSGKITEADMVRVDPAQVPESREATLSAGEIIVVRSGAYTGDSAIIPPKYDGAISGYDMVVTVKRGFSPFFAWQLLSPEVRRLQFAFCCLRAAQPHLNAEELQNTIVVTPPLDEQRSIAEFLDRETGKLDALVQKKERLIATLQEKRTALISHAVTKGLNPAAPMKDSGIPWLGKVPAKWSLKKIGYFARVGNGSTPSRENPGYWLDGKLPWLNSSVVNDAVVGDPPHFVTATALKECHLPIVRPGTVLVAITGEGKTRGKAAVLGYEATISQHIAFIAPHSREADPHFIRFSLESVYDVLRVLSEGAGSTKGALTCDQLRQFKIPLPRLEEQRAIVEHLNTETAKFDALVAKVRTGIERLQEYRTALISAAVTGKIDVRQAQPSASKVVKPPPAAFRRAVFAAEVIHQLHDEPTFGHVKCQKILHLAEHHLGLPDFESNYFRQAAGPYDNQMMRSIDGQLERLKWFRAAKRGEAWHYDGLANAGQHEKYFGQYWGQHQEGLQKLLALLRKLDTERCEILSTLYAVWNDFLLAGASFDDAKLADEAIRWHPAKQRIERDRWLKALVWMRERGLVPRGTGKPTKVKK